MTFPHGQKGHPKNWPLIKRLAQWHVQGVRLADQMRTLESEGSKYGKRNAFDKFRNQNKTEINDEIQTLSNDMQKRTEITADRVLNELKCSGYFDPECIFNEDGTVKSIQEIPEEARRAIASIDVQELWEFDRDKKRKEQIGVIKRIKFWDKPRNLELMGKNMGMFVDKSEVKIDASALTEKLGELLGATVVKK